MSEEQSPLVPPGAGLSPGQASVAHGGLLAAKVAHARDAAERFARLAWFARDPEASRAFRAQANDYRERAESLARIAASDERKRLSEPRPADA